MTVAPAESSGVYSRSERFELRSVRIEGSATTEPTFLRPPAWVSDVSDRLNQLVVQAGVRVDGDVVHQFVRFVRDPAFSNTPSPRIGPAGDGGLTVEFEGADAELIIEFQKNTAPWVYVHRWGNEFEGPIDELPDGIEKWAWRLGSA